MNPNKKRVGILGGTLNPIHNGHLLIAEQAYYQYQLEYVQFMPSGNPPHKSGQTILSGQHRANMTKLAIADNTHFQYSDLELTREGIIYTSDTLSILCEKYPDTEFYFILGADSLFSFETWHKPEEILKRSIIIVAGRPDIINPEISPEDKINEQITYLIKKYKCKIEYMNSPLFDVSPTAIRSMISDQKSVHYLIPPAVEQYIYENNLYQDEKKEGIYR